MNIEEIELNELPQTVWNNEEKDYMNGQKDNLDIKSFNLKQKMSVNPSLGKFTLPKVPSIDIDSKFNKDKISFKNNKINKFIR